MISQRLLRLGAIAAASIGVLGIASPSVLAADSTRVADSGFWWQANSGIGANTEPPGVNRGQLLAEATPASSTTIIAIRGELADGQGSPTITLDIASQAGAATAVILACQAGAGWTGTHSGSFSSAPAVDCDSGAVAGVFDAEASTFAFPIAPLQFGDQFNIVIVAGVDPASGDIAPFRVVFDKPTNASVTTVSGATAPPPPPPVTTTLPTAPPTVRSSPGGVSPSTTQASTSFVAPRSADSSFVTPSAPQSAPAPTPALPDSSLGQTPTAPILAAQTNPQVFDVALDSTDTGRLRLFGLSMLVAGLVTGFLWWRNEHALPLRAVITGVDADMLARLNASQVATETEGGLGRFRTARSGEAPRLF